VSQYFVDRPEGHPRRRREGRIELLNARWHRPAGARRLRSCPVCRLEVVADDHALQAEGELYHARCALKGEELNHHARKPRRP
jgi:hypothetical protein